MRIRCGNCGTLYNIKDSLITDKPRKVRCSKCSHVFTVRRSSKPPAEQSPIKLKDQAPALGATPISKPPPTKAPDGTESSKDLFADSEPPPSKPSQAPAETKSAKPLAAEEKPLADSAAPPAQQKKWQVRVEGEVYEDLDLMTMKKWIREGRLQLMDQVLGENGEWVIAADIPILMRYFQLKESIDTAKGKTTLTRDTADIEYCTTHPQEIARWKCTGCGKKFCPQCVKYQTFGMLKVPVCDKCNERCVELKPPKVIKPFWTQIPQMLAYPFVKGGALITIIGAIVAVLPYIGLIIYPYSLSILNASAQGKERMPDWPDFSDIFEDIFLPTLRLMIGSLYVFVPLGLYIYVKFKFMFDLSDPSTLIRIILDPINLLFIIFAWVYLPMVTIIVAVFKRLTPALNPVTVFKLINAIKKEYFIALILGLLFTAISAFISAVLRIIPLGKYLGEMVGWYFLIVEMRLLGLMVFQVEEKLGWD